MQILLKTIVKTRYSIIGYKLNHWKYEKHYFFLEIESEFLD